MIDPKVKEEVLSKHPEAVFLTAAGKYGASAVIAVVPPNRAKWRRFKLTAADERKRPDAYEVLVRDCLVYPEPAAFEDMLEQRPGLAETFASEVLELAGAGLDVEKNG